ncbi:MAG: hypothetical protein NT154_21320 [Verrucomicrobia bacterium]|nr:hypothetical protein [Verrucomicrobiota bacterium]
MVGQFTSWGKPIYLQEFLQAAGLSVFDLKMDLVEIGLALSPALNADEARPLKFGDQLSHTRTRHAHVSSETFLAREAGIVVPGVAQKHSVDHFGADGQSAIAQYEIRHLRKSRLDHGIGGVEQDIALLDCFANGLHGMIISQVRGDCLWITRALPFYLFPNISMEQNHHNQQGDDPQDSAAVGRVRNDSEGFRNVPHFSEGFGIVPKVSERKEDHTLTVREVARMFEVAGVARTERSITNWCQPNKSGIARLDSYFDPNERKYYIAPQSVELAIGEEKAKAVKRAGVSEPVGSNRKDSEERHPRAEPDSESGGARTRELENEVLDLKIINRGKDYFIDELRKERETFAEERQGYVEKLMAFNRKVGELETKLLQLEAPDAAAANDHP